MVQIWRSLSEIPADLTSSAVAIGNFDGVHLGHQHVIAETVAAAVRESGERLPVVVVTFDPHPMEVLRPEHAPAKLTSITQRAELLAVHGADFVLALPFDREIASWSPAEFIDKILIEALHAKTVVVGANFRFGAKAAGDVTTLSDAGAFAVTGVELDGGPQVWSSTYVRTCLAAGDVSGASEALGRPYSVTGVVKRGDQRGRELGYPTANVYIDDVVIPEDGVYAGWLHCPSLNDPSPDGSSLGGAPLFGANGAGVGGMPAAISVGSNPTFAGERQRRVEAYAIDRDDLDLYDREVTVEFIEHLREMVRFDGVEPLLVQMRDDITQARSVLGVPEPAE